MKPLKLAFPLLVALVLLGATASAYAPPRSSTPQVSSLEGQFLVASRKMADPNFSRCVIYIVAHTDEGAMGLVVNRVFGAITLRDLFGDLGIKNAGKVKVELHYGGPVENSRGFVLHSADYTGAGTQLFRNGIALSMGLDIVRAVAEGKGPKRAKFLSGYTGWAAGQLEAEMARGDWLVAPADPELMFSTAPDSVWEKALQRAGIAL
jgi:putative transcriptional regulator